MIYDTTTTMGKYWHLRDWWKLIHDTFCEYVECNVKLFNAKKAELDKRYDECQDKADFANIWMEEGELYNYILLRSALNAGLMYIFSQFEKQMIELARVVVPGYTPPSGGVIVDAYNSIQTKSELELCSSCCSSWNYILDFQQIRHACVHYNGITYKRRHIEAIERLGQLLEVTERPDGGWEICLTKENLLWISDKMGYFYGLLIDELEKTKI